ncbi:hypothetical protein BKA93DRAFT_747741 [Sparassis latifolia]|uniref:Uncharacterized protein n=1 Tax=Sparassis crispa TaxID=139825 RepID=A0A401GYE4_9APHY|nr:predicted protein [Sparassis crispa]GBE87227.1 predicted protein [Sparassis crispa]
MALFSSSTTKAKTPPETTWSSSIQHFFGKPAEDPPVQSWLDKVARACKAQKVSSERWPEFARPYLNGEAKKRLGQLESVLQRTHGQQWCWTWATFSAAMNNMKWDTDKTKTVKVKVQKNTSGGWWVVGRGCGTTGDAKGKTSASRTPKARSSGKAVTKKTTKDKGTATPAKALQKKATSISGHKRSVSVLARLVPHALSPSPPPPPQETITVPLWLLAASDAVLEAVNRNPDATSATLAAILIAISSIPMPAAGIAQTIGTVAAGVGTALLKAHMTSSHAA